MDGLEGRKLNGRQVEARGLGALNEHLGGLLVQAPYQMSLHEPYLHRALRLKGQGALRAPILS